MRLLILAVLAFAAASTAHAHEVKAGDLTLSDLAVRASLGTNPNTAAYLTIRNAGAKPDRLLSASCACAAKVETHATMTHDGMAMMHPTGPLVVPASGALTLAPGGTHLMFTGLKTRLIDGRMQDVTLRFERAGLVKAGFHVKAVIGGADVHADH